MSVTIRVPATSANVGVGFDCLGIALDLEASFHFEASDDGQLHIAGCPQRFRGADNLVWTSYLHACKAWGLPSGLLSINIDSPIPLAGGSAQAPLASSLGSVLRSCLVAKLSTAKPHCASPLRSRDTLTTLRQRSSVDSFAHLSTLGK